MQSKMQNGLDEFEREALLLVGRAAMQVRVLARELPASTTKDRILPLAEGMHKIPSVLASSDEERQRHTETVADGVVELNLALGISPKAIGCVTH
ncbi:hypothetical protein OR214_02252 [Ralstonia pickettii OR214]|jgi:hypothetical protein|uniref:Uncharacterized protein n=1 Tax=Ralstonia pickettii OR214 TaxID=1264675 RepID=R0CMT1_RALPI|nr:hypothetical protein OR214_02252 [Ralstonia pickettii OR214]